MIYSTWDIEPDGLKFLILGYFLPFNALTTWKSEFWENEKKSWGFHHFTRVPKIMIIWCKIAEIRNLKDFKNEKKKKKRLEILSFYTYVTCLEISSSYTCVPKIIITWCMVPWIWCATVGCADWRTEKVI